LFFPSYNEGFGIPLLEAMACGTLILASNTEVFHEVARDAAVFFDPYDSIDISKVLEVSLDEGIREKYIARGFEQVAKYSWAKCAEQTMSVYQQAMASKGC
jgi:glycosyltransferase involved in cell wall biosynthesis